MGSAKRSAPNTLGRELQLHGNNRNVRLHLDDVRKRLLEVEPELLTDLAEIATYVFAADCAIRRGGPAMEGMGERWRRTFRLVLGVRQPNRWRQPQRVAALRELLQFLSEDTWFFQFEPMENPPSIQTYLGVANLDADKSGGTTVILFSGGLNSIAGAVDELYTSNRHVVLVSRRLGGMTDKRQRELASDLRSRYPKRVTHVPVDAGLTKETEAEEENLAQTQFLIHGHCNGRCCDRRVGWNPILREWYHERKPADIDASGRRTRITLNPSPLTAASKRFGSARVDVEINIDNPFAGKTKVEVVQELMARPERASIRYTLSCSHTRGLEKYKPHCGSVPNASNAEYRPSAPEQPKTTQRPATQLICSSAPARTVKIARWQST